MPGRVEAAFILVVAGLMVGAAPAPVPARFKDGLIFVDATVAGATGVFLLDTGAPQSVLDARFARAAHVHLSEARSIEGRGGEAGARQGELLDVGVIGGPRRPVAPLVADLSGAAQAMGAPLAGILGEDYLQAFVLTLDYRGQRVGIATEAVDPPDATPIRFGQTPYVEALARLGERHARGEFGIDTGSNTAVDFWRPFARSAFGPVKTTPGVGLGVAGETVVERGHIDALEVAGRTIGSPEVNFADETRADDAGPRYAGVIGGPAWSGLVLMLDLPHRLMWLR